MLLLGPPGSGKTSFVAEALEKAVRLRRGDEVLLIVPTASMKHHLLAVLARRGLLVPGSLATTMTEFVRAATPGLRPTTPAVEDRLLRLAIERTAPPALGPTPGAAGLRRRIATLAGEFWAAGADNLQLEAAVRGSRQRAFLEVFREFEESISAQGLVHPNQRIARAAAAIRREGLGPVRKVYIDGFERFTRQQEELLEALAEQAEEIVVAMPDGLARYPLARSPVRLLPARPSSAAAADILRAASPRGEVLEIARRILAGGRPFSEHGVVLRSPEVYVPLVQEIFETLHIPFRVWIKPALVDHGVARHFLLWLQAAADGFPAGRTVEAIASPLSPVGRTAQADAFDFAVRERLPGEGLAFLLRSAQPFGGIRGFLETLRPWEGLGRTRFGAKRWARTCLDLLDAVQRLPVPVDGSSFRRACDWRAALRAQRTLRQAVTDAASLPEFEGRKRVGLAAFRDALEDILRATPLDVPDNRQDVVHVLPVLEARQWSLPTVFVCGLAEGWFPRHFAQDPLFDDQDRQLLRSRGIDLRTAADRAADERMLFRIARTRATERMLLSFPLNDALGKPLLPSPLLENASEALAPPVCRLGEREDSDAPHPAADLPGALLEAVRACNPAFSASGIADYRQCPYLYYARHTLGLRGRPAAPDRRLDSAQVGTIVHAALQLWNKGRQPIADILNSVFTETIRRRNIPEGFRAEQLRRALLADLERFAQVQPDLAQAFQGQQTHFESERQYRCGPGPSSPPVRCRIDRYDIDESGRCFVTDYKYARPARVRAMLGELRDGENLQLLIYLAALEQELGSEPAGMALCGLREETTLEGLATVPSGRLAPVGTDDLRALLEAAKSKTAEAARGVLQGSIAVAPRDSGYCSRTCEYGAVCRVRWGASAQPHDAARSEPACS